MYDANKKELSYQDIYPKAVKVTDGTYQIRVQVVASSVEDLDKLTAMPLLVDQALAKAASLTAYSSLKGAVREEKDAVFKKKTLQRGERATVWVSLEGVTAPKDASKGDVLIGKLNVVGGGKKVDGAELYKFGLVVPPAAEKGKEGDKGKKEDGEPDDGQRVKEAVRDMEIAWIKKIKDDTERDKLLARLESEWPAWLPFWVTRLEHVGEKGEKEERDKEAMGGRVSLERVDEIDAVAGKILALVDEKEVLEWFGGRRDGGVGGGEAERKKRADTGKDMDKKKDAVVLAYTWKAWCAKQRLAGGADTEPAAAAAAALDALAAVLDQLALWLPDAPTTHTQYLLAWSFYMQRRGQFGEVVRATGKWLKDAGGGGGKSGDARLEQVVRERDAALRALGWTLWAEMETRWAVVRKPAAWSLF